MTNQFKHILFKIAKLSKRDQRWILQRLSKKEQLVFIEEQGEQLIRKARHFRQLKMTDYLSLPSMPKLPYYCELLAKQSPLYIAIILEQENYPWQESFLTRFDHHGMIRQALSENVEIIKTATKEAVVNQWKAKHSNLESHHG